MKKILSILSVLLLGLVLVACGNSKYEIAMITDTGDIDDGSFNQGTWEGIVEYTKTSKVSRKYYKPAGEATADYLAAIDLAVSGGAKIVITPGFYFETPIFEAQTKYPDVKFVILDGKPHNGDNNGVVANNTLSVYFKEEEAGFLTGYGVVKDGFTKLGFMGGIPVPAVQRFGIGWVAGAYLAASELGLKDFSFNAANFTYLGTFGPSDEYKTQAASWYSSGIEVIHAAAGGAGSSVMAAAQESTNKWVVGVDSDQAKASQTVITSALKGVGAAAIEALEAFYADKFPGGQTWNLSAADNAVGAAIATGRFKNFKQADYDVIFNKVKGGSVKVPGVVADLVKFVEGLEYSFPAGLADKIVPPTA